MQNQKQKNFETYEQKKLMSVNFFKDFKRIQQNLYIHDNNICAVCVYVCILNKSFNKPSLSDISFSRS